ncbi:hypothetical protein Tco_0188702 [Tanacetum coccineum]
MEKVYSWLQAEETASEGKLIMFMDSITGKKTLKGRSWEGSEKKSRESSERKPERGGRTSTQCYQDSPGEEVKPLGEISLLITVGEAPHHRSEHITFLIVRFDSPQNMLFGRTAIAELGMIPSTMYSTVLYQSEVGPRVIMYEYQDVRRCEQFKRVKGSLLEVPLEISECANPAEKIIINQKYPEYAITIGSQLPLHFKKELVKILRDNADIFTWEYSDMTRIPRTLKIRSEVFITEHKLNENKKIIPVHQKKRGIAPEQSAATSKEVEELKKARILSETRYQTWVANTVMVKKTNEAWRMCVNFSYINKACPKDCYSLP